MCNAAERKRKRDDRGEPDKKKTRKDRVGLSGCTLVLTDQERQTAVSSQTSALFDEHAAVLLI